jgi:hypothetical protein
LLCAERPGKRVAQINNGIGDSITYGYEIRIEQTFARLLEDKLNRSQALGRDVEVLNFWVSGYWLGVHVEVYKEKVRPFKPDIAIIGYCLNDPMPPNAMFNAVADMMPKNASYTRIGQYSCKPLLE